MKILIWYPSSTAENSFSAIKKNLKKQKSKKVVGFITPKTLTRDFYNFTKKWHAPDLAFKKTHEELLLVLTKVVHTSAGYIALWT